MRVTTMDLSPQVVSGKVADIQSVYEKMYAIPVGGGEGFVPFLIEHSQREGFRFSGAFDQESGQMVGFGYGFTGNPGQTWRDALAEAVGAAIAARWLTGHFEFADFGVVPPIRRCGIGSQLYVALFSVLPQARAILTVREENEPARGFYAQQDWRVLYEGFFLQLAVGLTL